MPVPSFADFAWVIGYVPLVFALVTRYRKLKSAPTRPQRWFLFIITLSLLLLTAALVLRPTLADFDPQRAVEGILNLYYPLGDVLIFHLSCLVLVLLAEGRFALSWRLIVAGTLIMTLSDLLYSFATWQGFYYPDGRVNTLSILTDASYTIAYICSACGIYLYGLIWEIKEKISLQMEFAPSTRLYAFLGTNAENKIIDTSENFYCLVDGISSEVYNQKTLAEVFGLTSTSIQALFEKIVRKGSLYNETLTITTRDLQTREIWLIAEANYDPQQAYAGSIFVMTADIAVKEEQRLPRDREIRHIMDHLLSLAGSRPKDISQEMRVYFLETIRLFSSMLYQFGGPHYQDALLEALKRAIQQNNLPVKINAGVITTPEELQGEELACLLAPLLQTARDFVAGYVGEPIVTEELAGLEGQMNLAALHDLDTYRLRAFHQPA